ncbi:MAG: hypothetical protein ACFFCS_12320 [Candidatus Hodarchaeota archaeon]
MELSPITNLHSLSEIEKKLLSILQGKRMKKHFLYSRFLLPRSFLEDVLEILRRKNLIIVNDSEGSIELNEKNYNLINAIKNEFSKLSVRNNKVHFSRNEDVQELIQKMEIRYQNSLDLYVLDYLEESLEKIQEIISFIQKTSIFEYKEFFHELDIEFFFILCNNLTKSDKDKYKLVIDYAIDYIFKILEFLKDGVKLHSDSIGSELTLNAYAGFFKHQKQAIKDLKEFISNFDRQKESNPLAEQDRNKIKISAYLILHFDKKIGPKIFFQSNNGLKEENLDQIKKLMDILNPEPFFYSFQEIKTLNYQFELHSPNARGKKELLQITLIIDNNINEEKIKVLKDELVQIGTKIIEFETVSRLFSKQEVEGNLEENNHGIDSLNLMDEFLSYFRVLNKYLE